MIVYLCTIFILHK